MTFLVKSVKNAVFLTDVIWGVFHLMESFQGGENRVKWGEGDQKRVDI